MGGRCGLKGGGPAANRNPFRRRLELDWRRASGGHRGPLGTVAAAQRLDSVYNVAPDGWIGAELFRALRGEADVRLPQQLSEWRLRAAKSLANRSLLDGLEPYVSWPWVVANDKLRSTGWEPQFSNEEAFVAGTPPPLLASIDQQRRQEIALGVAGTAGAAALGAALWLARKTVK